MKTLEDMDRGIVLNPGTENEITLGDYIDARILEAIKSLRLYVDEDSQSHYMGCNHHGKALYEESKKVNIRLCADLSDEGYDIDEIEFTI